MARMNSNKLIGFLVFVLTIGLIVWTVLRLGPERKRQRDRSLIDAVFRGDTDTVRISLSKGADANAKDEDGESALGMAIGMKHPDAAVELIAHGAVVNAEHGHGFSLLTEVVFEGETSVVRAMLDKGADVNGTDGHGETPLLVGASVRGCRSPCCWPKGRGA